MKRGSGGFSIVESMIFLAVSGAMLVSVSLLFSRTQSRSQFAQSMRDIESKFQDIINDVSTGYFEYKNLTCTPGSAAPPSFSVGVQNQGTQKGCIYLGKAILLRQNATEFYVAPVIGNRYNGAREVETHTQAWPTTICCQPGDPEVNNKYELLWGVKVKDVNGAAPKYFAFGIYGSLAKYSAGTELESGAQKVFGYQHAITISSATPDDLKTCIRTQSCFYDSASPPNHLRDWQICFTNDAQTARITIGGNDKLTTKLEFISC